MSGAFANLIDNAVKYSHANKTVDIHGNLDGDYVKVTVGDYGLGIPEKDYERIFEPYYTSPVRDEIRSIDGMGIGLAVVKEVVEQHEGNVWVECSEPVKEPDDYQGRLVIFTVRLPLKQSGG
jgi:signal transduction histidine kinase